MDRKLFYVLIICFSLALFMIGKDNFIFAAELKNVNLVGKIGGSDSKDVFVQVNYAYVADGENGLRIIDISNPSTLVEAGQWKAPNNINCNLCDVYVLGNYAYVTYEEHGISNDPYPTGLITFGLRIIDISSPETPVKVGDWISPVKIDSIYVSGNYAYVTAGENGLRIIAISNPSSPIEIGYYDTPGLFAYNLFISGNYAYVASLQGLIILDVSVPSAPIEIGYYDSSNYAVINVFISGKYAYIIKALTESPLLTYSINIYLEIIDISNPSSIIEMGTYRLSGGDPNYYELNISENYAYVAEWHTGLKIINVSDPSSPDEVGYYNTPGTALGVYILGNYAYVADGDTGLRIINISNPSSPFEMGYYNSLARSNGICIASTFVDCPTACIADGENGLKIIAGTLLPVEVGKCATYGYANDICVSGEYAYVADGNSGLQIIIIDAPSPIIVGTYDTPGNANGVFVSGNYAYVADGNAGLRIIDISNHLSPTETGYYDTPGLAYTVFVSGKYAYVADGAEGIRIIDISNPSTPIEIGSYGSYEEIIKNIYSFPTDSPPKKQCIPLIGYWDIYVSGNYAYIAATYSLTIIDISNPLSPFLTGYYSTPGYTEGLFVSGNYAYMACGDSGLVIIDISNPSTPIQAGYYDTSGFAYDVAVSGNHIYVADGSAGLSILQFTSAYYINGFVKGLSGTGIGEVSVGLSGDKSATYITDDTGYYEFTVLSPGNYTITANRTGYTFTPQKKQYAILNSSQEDQNFTAFPLVIENQDVKILGGENGYINPVKGEKAQLVINPGNSGILDIKVYDLIGNLVWETSKEITANNVEIISWNGKNNSEEIVASGVYLCYIKAPGIKTIRKVAVIK